MSAPRSFDGTTVLVSGSARGQGEGHIRAFHERGASVVIADVLDEPGRALAAELGSERSMYVHLDVADAGQWRAAVDSARERFAPISVLVNNAGLVGGGSGDIRHLDTAEFERVMSVNLLGAVHGIQAVVSGMRERGGGSIINISSMVALNGRREGGAYSVSKWALRGLTKNSAVDLASDGIRVNAVLPGLIESPMNAATDPAEMFQRNAHHFLIPRLGRPSDITPMVLFLASDAASYVTGADIVIDGGWTAS